MAFVASPIPQEEQNQFGPGGQTTNNPAMNMPPQAGGSVGQSGGTSPNSGSPTQFGSGASRLSDYLSANAPQIQQEGANIAGNLTNQYGQVQSDIGSAQQGFQGEVGQSYTPMDQTLLTEAETNPQAVAGNPQQLKEFQGMYNDQYTGPANFETTAPYAQVQNEVQSAVSNAGLLSSPGGLSSYLQNNVETNPTQGQNTLDTVLLQANPGAQGAMQAAAKPFAGLTGQFQGATTAADQAVQDAQAAAQNTQQTTQAAFNGPGGVIPNFNAATQTELANAQNAAGQQEQTLLGDINSGKVTPADLAEMGISQDTWNQIQQQIGAEANPATTQIYPGAPGVTPTPVNTAIAPYLAQLNPQTAIGLGNTLTPQDYATAQALQALTGVNLNLPGDPAMPQMSTLDVKGLQAYLNSVGQGQTQGAQQQSLAQENAILAKQAAANQAKVAATNEAVAGATGAAAAAPKITNMLKGTGANAAAGAASAIPDELAGIPYSQAQEAFAGAPGYTATGAPLSGGGSAASAALPAELAIKGGLNVANQEDPFVPGAFVQPTLQLAGEPATLQQSLLGGGGLGEVANALTPWGATGDIANALSSVLGLGGGGQEGKGEMLLQKAYTQDLDAAVNQYLQSIGKPTLGPGGTIPTFKGALGARGGNQTLMDYLSSLNGPTPSSNARTLIGSNRVGPTEANLTPEQMKLLDPANYISQLEKQSVAGYLPQKGGQIDLAGLAAGANEGFQNNPTGAYRPGNVPGKLIDPATGQAINEDELYTIQ